jgi:hypothetical protein
MAKKVVVRVAPPSGDPVKEGQGVTYTSREPMARKLDIRDMLAELVGKGNAMSANDRTAIFSYLTSQIGQDKATKVMNHAYLFNQRPDVLKLPVEDKLKSFYTIGSNDPDVNQVIDKSRSLGYGVLPGFRNSSSAINQQLSGMIPASAGLLGDPSLQRK